MLLLQMLPKIKTTSQQKAYLGGYLEGHLGADLGYGISKG
jgi:hypothetical protein